jgi:DNA-binding NarL/FixJ family response regulator
LAYYIWGMPNVLRGVEVRAMTSAQAQEASDRKLIRVAFVEDHEAVRKSIENMLARRGCVVTASAATAAAAYDALADRTPDVAIVDINLPDESGVSLVRRLLTRHPALRVLMYTGSLDSIAVREAFDAGACGVVLKTAGLRELHEAISTVDSGEMYLDPRIRGLAGGGSGTAPGVLVSRREREVLQLLARGYTGEAAAEELAISPETVRTHVRNAMRKLGASTRTHAVVSAVRLGAINV